MDLIEIKSTSVSAFAKSIKVSQTTLSDYLNSGKTPSWAVLRGIIEAYPDISVEWLLRGNGDTCFVEDLPSTDHTDTDEVLELKTELTRLRAECAEYREEIVKLRAIIEYQEKRLDKMVGILHEEPRFSVVAEGQTYNHRNNIEL